MCDDSIDMIADESMDLNSFTNVPHLAHSTKAPPPVPPPRHSKLLKTEPSMEPPAYISLNDDYQDIGDSNDTDNQPLTGIDIDEDIRKALSTHVPYNSMTDTNDDISIDRYDISNREDFYIDPFKWTRDTKEPGVLLPLRANLFESYSSPFLMILSQIPQFSNLILKHQYLTFSYKQNWWNREKCSNNPLIVQEVQRLVAFLNGDSNRAFSSIYNLNVCSSRLVEEEIESVSDFYNFFIDTIIYFLTKTNGSFKAPLESMFKLVGAYEMDEQERQDNMYNIPLSSDDACQDLYQTIHNKFFQSDDPSERIFLLQIPDILPIIFDAGSSNIDGGFKIEEKFYPQIYSYEHKDILMKIEDELKILRSKHTLMNQKILQLRAFNGKSVQRLLVDSSRHLREESENIGKEESSETNDLEIDVRSKNDVEYSNNLISEKDKYLAASQSIGMLSANIADILKRANEEIRSINDKASLLQARKFNIDQLLDSETKSKFEPWILTGVILNAVQFYYREKKSTNWRGINISEETCKSYTTSELSFADIKNIVSRFTEYDFSEGMILIYVKESAFYDGNFDPLNRTLQDFINKDNVKLKERCDIVMNNEYNLSESSGSDFISSGSSIVEVAKTNENEEI